jgi:hypothetical protein
MPAPAPKTSKPRRSTAAKAAAPRNAAAAAAPAAAASAPATAAADARPAKTKLVRDSFTIPAAEYERIGQLKLRAATLARPTKKSELLRAGLQALLSMDNSTLLAALETVPTIKTGRPKAKKADGAPTKGKKKSARKGE